MLRGARGHEVEREAAGDRRDGSRRFCASNDVAVRRATAARRPATAGSVEREIRREARSRRGVTRRRHRPRFPPKERLGGYRIVRAVRTVSCGRFHVGKNDAAGRADAGCTGEGQHAVHREQYSGRQRRTVRVDRKLSAQSHL